MLFSSNYDHLHFYHGTDIHQYRQYNIWIITYKSNQDNEVLLNSIWQEIVIIVNKATTSLDRKHYLCFTWGKQSFSFFQIEAVMSAYDFHMQSGELYCSFLNRYTLFMKTLCVFCGVFTWLKLEKTYDVIDILHNIYTNFVVVRQ